MILMKLGNALILRLNFCVVWLSCSQYLPLPFFCPYAVCSFNSHLRM